MHGHQSAQQALLVKPSQPACGSTVEPNIHHWGGRTAVADTCPFLTNDTKISSKPVPMLHRAIPQKIAEMMNLYASSYHWSESEDPAQREEHQLLLSKFMEPSSRGMRNSGGRPHSARPQYGLKLRQLHANFDSTLSSIESRS
jgi:hypothetical protein